MGGNWALECQTESKVARVGLLTLEINFLGVSTLPVLSKTRQKEKPGEPACSELKMMEVGEDPVSDGKGQAFPFPSSPSLQRDQCLDLYLVLY